MQLSQNQTRECHFSHVSTFETNESDFIDTFPQSPNFPTNSLIYSKSDMLSRNSDSELTANVGSDRQRNFEGGRHEGASVKLQGPEAVPDFHIERERQSVGSSQAAALLDLSSRVELVRFSLFPYTHVIRVSAQSAPFFRDWHCLPFCILLI
ncbi:hypothetical protein ALC56_01964 [Trachymyrmex septentrionalis]|uniref:Uncharacterized protein n=1 Tax=Trachymyrmex septentrionalis TaxID=34720 RepID=A0A195FTT9_9HYME|nr:hypothetical protein ALC56_01964 [Trachymyrmex septentrionalis]